MIFSPLCTLKYTHQGYIKEPVVLSPQQDIHQTTRVINPPFLTINN